MSFLNRLFRWPRPSQQAPAIAAPSPASLEHPIDWDADDAAELRGFLRSDSGRRFGLLLRQRVSLSALHAVRTPPERLPWECGRSAGIEDIVAQVDLLADWQGELVRASAEEDEADRRLEDEDEGADDNLVWLRRPGAEDEFEHDYEHRD